MKAFWDQVHKTPDCWEWRGKQSPNGYGYIGSFQKVHRLSYELHKGPIPKGLVVKHTCDNKLCVNPDHLELGTYSENLKEAYGRGLREPKTAQRDSIRLSEEQIQHIRTSSNTPGALAKEFGISSQRVRSIREGKIRLREIDIESLRSETLPIKELAKKYGISKHQVALLREGCYKKQMIITQNLLTQILHLAQVHRFNGHPNYRKISQITQVSRKRVKKVLQDSKLKL